MVTDGPLIQNKNRPFLATIAPKITLPSMNFMNLTSLIPKEITTAEVSQNTTLYLNSTILYTTIAIPTIQTTINQGFQLQVTYY